MIAEPLILKGASQMGSNPETVSSRDAFAAELKYKPQERRPGLALGRKRARFSLQPSSTLEPALNVDLLEGPDEFFDAYESIENARKEIRKQLGDCINNLNEFKPSTTVHRRQLGIFGKSYTYKHRYSAASCENQELD